MKKKKTPTVATPAAKRRKSDGSSGVGPRTRARDNNGEVDLISTLPDAVLGTIISLLSTKDGARTQVLAHRWRPLWRSAPLNLDAKHLSVDQFQRVSIVSRILSDHPGPARCFSFPFSGLLKDKYKISMDAAKIEAWFDSRALDNLQELEISFELFELIDESKKGYPLPSSMFRLASTLLVATIEYCDFPNEIAPSVNFPLLKNLTLTFVSISDEVLHVVLSACHVLETLYLQEILQMGCLHISSPTLRAISFIACCSVVTEELVIIDTPLLERLLFPCLDGDGTIRVIRAPKLEILGPFSSCMSKIQIANMIFQGMIPSSLSNSICNVKVLALKYSVHDMNVVLDVLRCFPFLENLCVIWNQYLKVGMKKVRRYDPLDPIKCLETHLKVLVLKNYQGDEEEVDFVRFFVLNAKVVKEILFGVNENINKKWVADQHMLLGVKNKASRDAQFIFKSGCSYFSDYLNAHDLSVADPFHHSFVDGDVVISGEACG